jgi:hypothetical protein
VNDIRFMSVTLSVKRGEPYAEIDTAATFNELSLEADTYILDILLDEEDGGEKLFAFRDVNISQRDAALAVMMCMQQIERLRPDD